MLFLKQSTSVTVNIGPFIDDTTGKDAETGLTEHPADILLSKNGGDFAAKNEASNCTHDNLGWYHCPLDDTDTNTLGRLQLHCHEAGFLPVFHEYMVLPANVYDSLVLGSAQDLLDVSVVQIDGDATSLDDLKDFADAGYDPATNKVEGVKLVDTTTTNSDMITAATVNAQCDTAISDSTIHTDVGTAITDIGTLQTMVTDIHDTDLPAVKTDTGAIKAITDLLTLAAIADAVHDEVVEGAITLRQSTRLTLATLVGITSEVVPGTLVIRDANDTADRITATMDANRYRTGVVLNP